MPQSPNSSSRHVSFLRICVYLAVSLVFLASAAWLDAKKSKGPHTRKVICQDEIKIDFSVPQDVKDQHDFDVLCNKGDIIWTHSGGAKKDFHIDFNVDGNPFPTTPIYPDSATGKANSMSTSDQTSFVTSYKYTLVVNGYPDLDPHVIILGGGHGLRPNKPKQ